MAVRKLIPSIGFISIEVSNLKESKKYYSALAGALDLDPIEDDEDYAAWGNQEFHLWISEEGSPRVKRGRPTGKEEWGVSDCVGIGLPDPEQLFPLRQKSLSWFGLLRSCAIKRMIGGRVA
ncbi:MAG: hypothetical protein LUP94_02305 [Candidatus Methanomethylicus sp.]|nr:hypothetical protein [Candidatus Methanomethylicus sp.]